MKNIFEEILEELQLCLGIFTEEENKIPSKIDFDNSDINTIIKSPTKISEAVGNDWIEIN